MTPVETADSGIVRIRHAINIRFREGEANVLYVGKASNFRNEVWQTLARPIPVGMRFGPKMNRKRPQIWELTTYLSLYEIESRRLRHNVEALLIRAFINQTHNSNIGHFI